LTVGRKSLSIDDVQEQTLRYRGVGKVIVPRHVAHVGRGRRIEIDQEEPLEPRVGIVATRDRAARFVVSVERPEPKLFRPAGRRCQLAGNDVFNIA
jgi:hypothetical protein